MMKTSEELVSKMRRIAVWALRDMYRPQEGLVVFRKKKGANGITYEGLSRRYTAIVLIALANEESAVVEGILGGQAPGSVCRRLEQHLSAAPNLGDAALTLWACCVHNLGDRRQSREMLRERIRYASWYPTVEAAWALKALCVDRDAEAGDLRERLAKELMAAFNPAAAVFSHSIGNRRSFRDHVSCFADQIYPIQALCAYHRLMENKRALEIAGRCAEKICDVQGASGQWWWHYDRRTGKVIEGYPVYSVHQDAMAPMALFDLHRSGGADFTKAVAKGLSWMENAPEINASLIDPTHCAIWRKVDRRGPRKFTRYLKAAAGRIHASLPMSWIDPWFPPDSVDYECRPYHLAWLLFTWPEKQSPPLKGGEPWS
jgi:hypothetical protein